MTQTFNYDTDAIRRLALAMIKNAMQDSRKDSSIGRDARTWLLQEAPTVAQVCGLRLAENDFQRWLANGCKFPRMVDYERQVNK